MRYFRMKSTIIIFLTLIIVSCSRHQEYKNDTIAKFLEKKENKYFKKCFLFNDSSYIFTLTTIDTIDSYDINKRTALVNLYHINSGHIDTLLNDSLFCRNSRMAEPELQVGFVDFNFDGVKDIVLPAGTDPRENHGFHLYLVKNKTKSLHYVKGFEEIGNPESDSLNQLIESFVLSGQNFYKFYTIDTTDKLVDLGHEVDMEFNDADSLKHLKAISDILLERKRK